MVLTGEAVHRIVKDVKYIMKNPIKNIHYKHDTENITCGYALIIGNADTPYSYGNYLFEFIFPDNYPYEPPKVTILTSDGKMRFHPNLYKGGKVCLSIINTWHGEGWTSCNNINSILLTLLSILDNNSLTFEPGISVSDHNVKKYDILVGYKNIEHCIIKQIETLNNLAIDNIDHDTNNPELYKTENCLLLFKNEIIDNFNQNFNIITKDLQNLKDRFNKIKINSNGFIFISTYCLSCIIDFLNLEKLLMTLSITTGFKSVTIDN
jgi:ubiquitin-protein ligase